MTEDKRVDWSKPIEAVHRYTGAVLPVHFTGQREDGNYEVECPGPAPDDWIDGYHRPDGASLEQSDPWTIRNVRQPELSGNSGQLPAEVVERMVALVNLGVRLPAFTYPPGHPIGAFFDELRAIVAMLPAPVDPDLLEAREIIADAVAYGAGSGVDPDRKRPADFRSGDCDAGDLIERAVSAIRRGRDLARQDDARRVG